MAENSIQIDQNRDKITRTKSKTLLGSVFINSASKALSSSSEGSGLSTCFLQYSITFVRIFPATLGRGIVFSSGTSSIMCLIVIDSNAAISGTSKDSLSRLTRIIFLEEEEAEADILAEFQSGVAFFFPVKKVVSLKSTYD